MEQISPGSFFYLVFIHLLSSYFESGAILGTYGRSRDGTDETAVSAAGLLHAVNQAQLQGVGHFANRVPCIEHPGSPAISGGNRIPVKCYHPSISVG